MLSKNLMSGLSFLIASVFLTSCDGVIIADRVNDNKIGEALSEVSGVQSDASSKSSRIAIYDKTVHKIHRFDLTNAKYLGAFAVDDPDQEHYVFYKDSSSYLIDLTKKSLTIFKEDGSKIKNPVRLIGNPVSAAFNAKKGLFLVYDELGSVGLLKLSPSGDVLARAILGTELEEGASISAGDINREGQLIAALNSGEIALIDLDATLNSDDQQWVYTKVSTTLSNIRWLASLPNDAKIVLVQTTDKLALVDATTGTVLSEQDDTGVVVKRSRGANPHLVAVDENSMTMLYVQDSVIKRKTIYNLSLQVEESFLDLKLGLWNFVGTNLERGVINLGNENKTKKEFNSYSLSKNMLAVDSKEIVGKTTLRLTNDFIFALYDSELGYAVRYDISSDVQKEFKYFNAKHIKPQRN